MRKRYVLKNRFRFTMFITLVLLLMFTVLFSTVAYGSKALQSKTITVKAGDSIWSIASEINSNCDIREQVYKIKKLNNLTNSEIFPGMQLIVQLD